MAKFVDEMAESGGIWRNISEVWRNMARHRRNTAKFGGKLRNFGGIWRKRAKFGGIWRNILKIKKLRNVAKFEKNDEVWRNLSMKWQNVAEFGGMLAKFGEI